MFCLRYILQSDISIKNWIYKNKFYWISVTISPGVIVMAQRGPVLKTKGGFKKHVFVSEFFLKGRKTRWSDEAFLKDSKLFFDMDHIDDSPHCWHIAIIFTDPFSQLGTVTNYADKEIFSSEIFIQFIQEKLNEFSRPEYRTRRNMNTEIINFGEFISLVSWMKIILYTFENNDRLAGYRADGSSCSDAGVAALSTR